MRSNPPAPATQTQQHRGHKQEADRRLRNSDRPPQLGVLSALLHRITWFQGGVSVQSTSDSVVPLKTRFQGRFRVLCRKAVPLADVGASIAGTVPVFGETVKGALEASLKIQRMFERRLQNVEAIDRLVAKLRVLEQQIDSYSQSRHARWLIRCLNDTQKVLSELLRTGSTLDYEHVASSIRECEQDISDFISLSSVIGQAETQELVKKQSADCERRHEEQMALLVSIARGQHVQGPTLVSVHVWVIDPFGTKHLFLQAPSSYEAFGRELLRRYSRDTSRRPILERYVGRDLFELSRNDSRQVTLVTQQDLSTLDQDSTLVMSVISYCPAQDLEDGIKCPLCKNAIRAREKGSGRILCPNCDKNVQLSLDGEDSEGRADAVHEEPDDYLQICQIVLKVLPDVKPESMQTSAPVHSVEATEEVELPQWLIAEQNALQQKYPDDRFQAIYARHSEVPGWRVKCADCPGKSQQQGELAAGEMRKFWLRLTVKILSYYLPKYDSAAQQGEGLPVRSRWLMAHLDAHHSVPRRQALEAQFDLLPRCRGEDLPAPRVSLSPSLYVEERLLRDH
ncbi:hypothetical protein NMY22_g10028 [Coprinellus aureogranulatus]|nr:hypothetical protein NMY22_g10028 [Coprinellus aureogranulatus]